MKLLFGSFWRAVAYCLHPRVIMLSLLPLMVAGIATLGLGYFYWEDANRAVRTRRSRRDTRAKRGRLNPSKFSF